MPHRWLRGCQAPRHRSAPLGALPDPRRGVHDRPGTTPQGFVPQGQAQARAALLGGGRARPRLVLDGLKSAVAEVEIPLESVDPLLGDAAAGCRPVDLTRWPPVGRISNLLGRHSDPGTRHLQPRGKCVSYCNELGMLGSTFLRFLGHYLAGNAFSSLLLLDSQLGLNGLVKLRGAIALLLGEVSRHRKAGRSTSGEEPEPVGLEAWGSGNQINMPFRCAHRLNKREQQGNGEKMLHSETPLTPRSCPELRSPRRAAHPRIADENPARLREHRRPVNLPTGASQHQAAFFPAFLTVPLAASLTAVRDALTPMSR